ncbi:DUF3179 domain-containing protein [Oceanisphaera sp.]|uniref:DUF3179 domain-containing protein n=1 Tax=Oceanisphaera sp. TaxID=1929979 RepID=UPI003A95AE3E
MMPNTSARPPRFTTPLGTCLRWLLILGLLLWGIPGQTQTRLNGFNLDDALIPAAELLPGGPPRDGIPAIDNPGFIDAILAPRDEVIGLAYQGETKAYPVAILNWHEVVNDYIGGQAVAITYCPLCATAVVLVAEHQSQPLTFGVSGLLYNSNLLLYDRQSESLWPQVLAQAVTGPMKGLVLPTLPLSLTSWQEWREAHPDTKVLSADTGYFRNYERDPYREYARRNALMFPIRNQSRALPLKEMVTGLVINGEARAYPHRALRNQTSPLYDTLGGERIRIETDTNGQPRFFNDKGKQLSAQPGYWFAWYAFYPNTQVWEIVPPAR